MAAYLNSSYLVAAIVIVLSSIIIKSGAFPSMSIKRVFTCLQDATSKAVFGSEQVTLKSTFYDLTDIDMAGNKVSMSSFKNSVLLIVNVASKCGLTDKNYSQLSQLADDYSSRGLKILAFPCNQFAGQEPVSTVLIEIQYQLHNKITTYPFVLGYS
jgi:hypothetical protein